MQNEWQPISNCPLILNGIMSENFLCWDGDEIFIAAYYDYDYTHIFMEVHPVKAYKGWLNFNNEIVNPTHWMPLPQPPEGD